jgi:hypothetical protein
MPPAPPESEKPYGNMGRSSFRDIERSTNMGLIKLAAAGAVGYALYKYANKEKLEVATAGGDRATVRDSGPEQMTTPPKAWSKTDEAIDESFPASDPPSTY